MNRAYRLIWNEQLGSWQVAPEFAAAKGKRSGGRVFSSTLAIVAALLGLPGSALAGALPVNTLPVGAQVVAGQASIATQGSAMSVNQGSARAIINWQAFDIGNQASVTFYQPDARSVALNRVLGPMASQIEGRLTANGQVFLVNPHGVVFGAGAQVNVGALVSSSLDIRNDDFMRGNYVFSGTGGQIENQGQIAAQPGGYVAFISPTILNSGSISAPQGTVALAAGERVRLNFSGDRLVGMDVSADTLNTLIANRGAIRAADGSIFLTAAAAEAVTRGVINNSGVLEASSLRNEGGKIVLAADGDMTLGKTSIVAVDGQKGGQIEMSAKGGTLIADGEVSAQGNAGLGGSVSLLGQQVGLVNAAKVNASGAAGGGTVLVGGDYQGKNAEVANAKATYVGSDVTIEASALKAGDGGRVIVWADETTRFLGRIVADGAGQGDGGFVETSGKSVLVATGDVSARAPNGRTGTWLLDPNNITIQAAGSNTNVTGAPDFTSTDDSAIVTTGSIQTALNAGTSVTVTTGTGGTNAQAGNITVASAIAKTAGGNAGLTLNAANNIVFNSGANVTSSSNQLGVTLNAGGAITSAANINTNGGVLTYNATGASVQSGVLSGSSSLVQAGAGTLALSATNTYTGTTTINAGSVLQIGNGGTTGTLGTGAVTDHGSLVYNRTNALTVANAISGTGGLTKNGSGTLTLSGANSYTGTTTINTGTLALGANNVLANTTAVTINSGATFSVNSRTDTVGSIAGAGAITTTAGGALTTGADGTSTTYSGRMSGAGTLTKTGAGTLTLSGANTYSGTTTVSGGTLQYGANNAISTGAVVVNDGGTYDLNNYSDSIGALTVRSGVTGGTVKTGTGTLTLGGNITSTGGASNALISGNLSVGATTRTVTTTNAADGLTISANVSGTGGLSKAGAGTATLSGTNTYSGTTTVSAGTLVAANNAALGATTAGTTVSSGATLALQGGVAVGAEALSLTGSGVSTTGALRNLSGDNSWGGVVTLAGTTEIQSDAGKLTLAAGNSITGTNRALTVDGAGDVAVNGTITTGTGTMTKTGAGTLTLSGTNTYTGTTTVSGGTLQYGANNAISTGAVVVNDGGTYDLNNYSDSIGALTVRSGVTGGTVKTGTGTLTLGGNITSTGGASNALISGNLSVGATTRTVTTTNAADGLTISANVSGTGGLSKAGAGTATLSGTNTYSGTTTVSAGTLVAANNAALGATTAGTTVSSGATLALQGGVAVGAEALSLTGSGVSTTGALRNLSGDNSWGGVVTLVGPTEIQSDAGKLTLTAGNSISGIDRALTVDGAGDVVVNGAISTGFGTMTKTGAGTLTLSGANAYSGTTTVSGGTLVIANNGALGNPASGTTVANGATLIINNVSIGTEGISIAGNGTDGAGALKGTGTATLAGNVTQTAASTVGTTSAGSTLTLNGSYNAASFQTTIAGPGSVSATNATNDFATVLINGAQNVSLRDANALALGNGSLNGNLVARAATTLTLGGAITADASGDAIVLSAGRFVNSAGSNALATPSGHWLVWSSNPNPFAGATPDDRGGLVYDFKQYNATYGSTTVLGSGSGFLYTLAPSITPGLTGEVAKVYDATLAAPVSSANYTATGLVDGDTAVFSGAGTYSDKNVGSAKTVTVTGIGATASNGTAAVYGYAVSPTTVNANIGTITPAALNLNAVSGSKVYDATTASSGVVSIVGLQGSDNVSGLSQSYTSKNVLGSNGSTLQVNGGYTINDGNGGANYTVSTATASGTITPAALNLNAVSGSKVYDATTASSGVVSIVGLQGSDNVSGLSQSYTSKNVLGSNGSTLQVNGGYTINDGNGGANYTVSTATASGTITPATLVIAANDATRPFGTPNPPFSASYSGFVGGEDASVLGGALNFWTNAKLLSPAGNYALQAYGQSSTNYAIRYVDGTVTVTGTPKFPGAGLVPDMQAIGATYSQPLTEPLTLARVVYVQEEGSCAQGVGASSDGCAPVARGESAVRIIGGGLRLPE